MCSVLGLGFSGLRFWGFEVQGVDGWHLGIRVFAESSHRFQHPLPGDPLKERNPTQRTQHVS